MEHPNQATTIISCEQDIQRILDLTDDIKTQTTRLFREELVNCLNGIDAEPWRLVEWIDVAQQAVDGWVE